MKEDGRNMSELQNATETYQLSSLSSPFHPFFLTFHSLVFALISMLNDISIHFSSFFFLHFHRRWRVASYRFSFCFVFFLRRKCENRFLFLNSFFFYTDEGSLTQDKRPSVGLSRFPFNRFLNNHFLSVNVRISSIIQVLRQRSRFSLQRIFSYSCMQIFFL